MASAWSKFLENISEFERLLEIEHLRSREDLALAKVELASAVKRMRDHKCHLSQLLHAKCVATRQWIDEAYGAGAGGRTEVLCLSLGEAYGALRDARGNMLWSDIERSIPRLICDIEKWMTIWPQRSPRLAYARECPIQPVALVAKASSPKVWETEVLAVRDPYMEGAEVGEECETEVRAESDPYTEGADFVEECETEVWADLYMDDLAMARVELQFVRVEVTSAKEVLASSGAASSTVLPEVRASGGVASSGAASSGAALQLLQARSRLKQRLRFQKRPAATRVALLSRARRPKRHALSRYFGFSRCARGGV